MGIYATKSRWQQALKPVVRLCVRYRVHPDMFTYGALVLSLVASSALIAAGANPLLLWAVPPCLILRLVFNLMDGLVARDLALADAFGEVKNEFGDRVADSAIFLALCFGGYADPHLAAAAIVLILCVSYLGILAKAVGGRRIYSGVFGKGDRMISLAVFSLYPALTGSLSSYNVYLAFAVLAAAVTIFQRLWSIHGHAQSVR